MKRHEKRSVMMVSTTTLALVASFAFVASFALLPVEGAGGQTLSKAEEEVRRLEREWLDAYEKRDPVAMERIVADDFTITFPDGSVMRKPQVVEGVKRPRRAGLTVRFRTEGVESRVYGDTVILMGVVVGEYREGEKVQVDESRYTDVYHKRDGRWQVVASHLSRAEKKNR